MSSPKVSVIMPIYNASRFVRTSLSSILNQSFEDLEILICDDGSSDDSLAIVQSISDERIRVFKNVVNRGYLRTINFLVEQTRGEFVCFQDADDYSHQDRIRLQCSVLTSNRQLGLVGTNYALVNEHGRLLARQQVELDPGKLKQALLSGNPFQKPSIMFSRQVYEKVGMYRPEFLELGNISEDFDWILRASEHFSVVNINHTEPLYYYRSVPTAMSKNILSAKQLFGHDIALFLAKQRRAGEDDSIVKGDFKTLHDLISQWQKPYIEDGSLLHNKLAESLMYFGLPSRAIRHSMMAICKGPFRWRNYRLFQYCVRKTLLGL